MELQIQDLVSSIKKEGIDSANREAAALLAEAQKRADAAAEIEVFKNSARLDAEQAKRDAALAFRQEVQKEFKRILSADIGKALDTKALCELIRAALRSGLPVGAVDPFLFNGRSQVLNLKFHVRSPFC